MEFLRLLCHNTCRFEEKKSFLPTDRVPRSAQRKRRKRKRRSAKEANHPTTPKMIPTTMTMNLPIPRRRGGKRRKNGNQNRQVAKRKRSVRKKRKNAMIAPTPTDIERFDQIHCWVMNFTVTNSFEFTIVKTSPISPLPSHLRLC